MADWLALDRHWQKRDPEGRVWVIDGECLAADGEYLDS